MSETVDWIKVSEDRPRDTRAVWVYDGLVQKGHYDSVRWYTSSHIILKNVTHWAEIVVPKPPYRACCYCGCKENAEYWMAGESVCKNHLLQLLLRNLERGRVEVRTL